MRCLMYGYSPYGGGYGFTSSGGSYSGYGYSANAYSGWGYQSGQR